MRLNLAKYTFSVGVGKFLGFILTHRVIEANPDKCTTILERGSPKNLKEEQRFVRRAMALSRFIPKLAERIRPILRKTKKGV